MSETTIPDKPHRHGLAWSEGEERRLYDGFVAGHSMAAMAEAHDRTRGGIRSHLKLLGLIDDEGVTVLPTPAYAPTPAAEKRTAQKAEAEAKALTKAAARGRAAVTGDSEKTAPTEINPRFADALRMMGDTRHCVFITGKAGTGKSTLLRHFRSHTAKNVVVLAPTGIAALNVGGQTIHHFFRFTIDVTPQKAASRKKPRNAGLYKKLDTIVIDEVSMVRADILDCIDAFLRRYGPQAGMAFGGVQMVFIGDLYQLPPVVGAQDRAIFSDHYETPYFFSAHVMQDFPLQVIELEKVYRQKDLAFVELLNRVRNNSVTGRDLDQLNSRLDAASAPDKDNFSINLTATNRRADEINHHHLQSLGGKVYGFNAQLTGDFGREYFPAAPELAFKIGAQVMMLSNDKDGRWVNGSLGLVQDVRRDSDQTEYIVIRLQDQDEPVAVTKHTWEVFQFALSDSQIESEPIGTFTQYPFRLAWAVTIHKSQGKTFERVTIDIGHGAFAAGQVYVALSRCTTFEGITLKTPIKRQHIQTDPRIHSFMRAYADTGAPPLVRLRDKTGLIEQAIRDGAAIEMLYLKADDKEVSLIVHPRSLGDESYKEVNFLGMKAFYPALKSVKLFSVARILQIKAVADEGQPICSAQVNTGQV